MYSTTALNNATQIARTAPAMLRLAGLPRRRLTDIPFNDIARTCQVYIGAAHSAMDCAVLHHIPVTICLDMLKTVFEHAVRSFHFVPPAPLLLIYLISQRSLELTEFSCHGTRLSHLCAQLHYSEVIIRLCGINDDERFGRLLEGTFLQELHYVSQELYHDEFFPASSQHPSILLS